MKSCIQDLRNWMLANGLMLNDSKTEFMIIGTPQELSKVNLGSIHVGDCMVTPAPITRNLGSWFDVHVNEYSHSKGLWKCTLLFT